MEIAQLIELHNGQGNKTRNSAIWQQLRHAILERDNYICQDCAEKATTVHHTTYGDIMNKDLISLCSHCHMRRHGLDPELISLETEEKRGLGKRIDELKTQLEAYDNHWLMPYMMSREYWEKYRRPYYIDQIKEMENRLRELAK